MGFRNAYCSVPGKLMIGGEYSVLLPGGVSLAMAIEDRLTVSVRPGNVDMVYSSALGLDGVSPERTDALCYVKESLNALRAVYQLPPLEIHIEGTMGQLPDGNKLGLGSSSAVCVGLVGACLRWIGETVPDTTNWFELAHKAHSTAQGKLGSGYDVITQIQGGVVVYRRLNDGVDTPLWETPSQWQTSRAQMPKDLWWSVLFSGRGASTRRLVQQTFNHPATQSHLERMRRLTTRLVDVWQHGNVDEILHSIDETQTAFEVWGAEVGGAVFPAAVQTLCEVVRAQGAVPRISGAGGGDCILVFAPKKAILESALSCAAEFGGKPVSLSLAGVGARAWCVD